MSSKNQSDDSSSKKLDGADKVLGIVEKVAKIAEYAVKGSSKKKGG